MKLFNKVPFLALLAILTFSCTTDSLEDQTLGEDFSLIILEDKSIEVEILELINDHRLTLGLNPLSDMSIIKSVAYTHTDYMVDNNEVSHANFFKRSEYLKTNAGASKVSENVAYGYSTAEAVVNAWLKSDGHRATIEGDFTNFDISAEVNTEGKWYYTNIFIKK